MEYHQSAGQRAPLMNQLPPCDSFFVENIDDDEGRFVVHNRSTKEGARLADERMQCMADDMSRAVIEEYQEDVLDHMEYMEGETLPDVDSIDIQTEIQWFMRPYLLDFLIEAHIAFQLLPETLFLTINLLDRYCSKRVVYKRHYQLVGCAAMLIAAKYGDKKDRVPTIRELKSMCCSLYDEDMFIQMEWHVLQTLNWLVGHPTIDNFLQMVLSEADYDPEAEYMARYICEIAMFHKDFVSTRPSVMARSALALARHILGREPARQSDWAANYDTTTIVLLSQFLHRPSQVLVRKYSSSIFGMVAVTLDEFMTKQANIARRQMPLEYAQEDVCAPQILVNDEKQGSNTGINNHIPMTPQKDGSHQQMPPHGYLTPPETPNGDYFDHNGATAAYKIYPPGYHHPVTPVLTPNSSFTGPTYYAQ